MKATIRDTETFLSIRPIELASYLRANRWKEMDHQKGHYSVWYKNDGGEPIEILLPLNREFRDYAARIAEVIQTLEIAEERSQIDILTDIQSATYDVTRIAAEDKTLENGTIALSGGVQFIEHTLQLMLAAACSAAQPRPVYYSRKPNVAVKYIDQARMGTARGSFVVMINTPILPALRTPQQMALFGEQEEPFARRVSRVLMQALAAARQAADRAVSTGDLAPFFEAVEVGVSANLCDALVGLQQGSGAEQIRIRMSWSPIRQAPEQIAQMVVIPSNAIPIIKEAGRLLREISLRDNFSLQGFVVRLVKVPRSTRGRVTVRGLVDGVFRNVQFDLDEEAYQRAIEAHSSPQIVRCEGELARDGRQYILRNPRNFMVIEQ